MDVMKIPFVESVGIERDGDGVLTLPFDGHVHNHLQTVHAAALFALAETASGDALLSLFPDLVSEVVPLLRDSQIKYKKPATTAITAYPVVSDEAVSNFLDRLERKGRASITMDVELRDNNAVVTCRGSFNWYVQRIGREQQSEHVMLTASSQG